MKPDRLAVFARFVLDLTTLSKCTDKHVAAIIVDAEGTQILSIGINGGPKGGKDCLCTFGGKYTCAHAEANALVKCHADCRGAAMICSFSPCVTCATLIINAGISEVYYLTKYKDDTGVNMLLDAGINVVDCGLSEDITSHQLQGFSEIGETLTDNIVSSFRREVNNVILAVVCGVACIICSALLIQHFLG